MSEVSLKYYSKSFPFQSRTLTSTRFEMVPIDPEGGGAAAAGLLGFI